MEWVLFFGHWLWRCAFLYAAYVIGYRHGFWVAYDRYKGDKAAPMPAAPEPVISKPDAYCTCGHSQSVHSRASGECYWVAYVAFDKPNLRCKCKSFKNAAADQ